MIFRKKPSNRKKEEAYQEICNMPTSPIHFRFFPSLSTSIEAESSQVNKTKAYITCAGDVVSYDFFGENIHHSISMYNPSVN